MLKKTLKLFSLVVLMWIVSLLTIHRQYNKYGSMMMLGDSETFEDALRNIQNKYQVEQRKYKELNFEVWQLMEPNTTLSKNQQSVLGTDDKPPGNNGRAVILHTRIEKPIKIRVRKGWKDHAFNQFVSDLIPLNRSLLDVRDEWCKQQSYSEELPVVSIVICFHNEAWSTLLRTVHSVLNRTPSHLLQEVILFDDFSTMSHLKKPLDDYVGKLPKVVLKRATRREGLIRARLLAIKDDISDVIVFLDSHCECTTGWLEPLLDRIAENITIVASPMIDYIHASTFEYIAQDTNNLHIGGFNWQLAFKWNDVPSKILAGRINPALPIKTPTISGGLFAISNAFFKKLGYYDEGFDIWGAENLELSFKTWMCGGSLEIVPCSHVGHVFRKRIPYKVRGSANRNRARLAEVWMDDYAKYFYKTLNNQVVDYGNITLHKNLRKKLNCKSFKWYMENIYSQLELPDKYAGSGQIYSLSNFAVCLDDNGIYESIIQPCHLRGGNQYWIYTKNGEIRRGNHCLDYNYSQIIMKICDSQLPTQTWLYSTTTRHIKNMKAKKCVTVSKFSNRLKLILEKCSQNNAQKWKIENYVEERLAPELRAFIDKYNITI